MAPDTLLVLIAALLAIAVMALLRAESTASRRGIWLAKPVASTLFVVAAGAAGAFGSTYGQFILAGLVLSWLGDVFLIPKRQGFFVAGLGSFLLAHVAYSGAFLLLPMAAFPLALASVGMVVVATIILRWLWPQLSPDLRPAVLAYLLVISLMVVLAIGTTATSGLQLAAGAVMFAASDIFVARDRFVRSSVTNRLLGLPLYYAAQMILAWSTLVHA